MAWFSVRVHDPEGGTQALRVMADDAQAAAASVAVGAAQVLDVRLADAPRTPAGWSLRLFSQELSLLLDAGVPLLEALQTLREKSTQDQMLESVCQALQQGQPLSAALALLPQCFDPLFVALVAASERSGQLPRALAHHAELLTWTEQLRAKLVAASIYPLMLLAAGGAVLLFLLLFVLPRFAGVFEGTRQDLPAASLALMQLGQAAGAHPQASLAGVALVCLLLGWAWRQARRSPAAAAALWRMPGLGPRLRTLALARLYRSLGLLLESGVPLTAALRLCLAVLPLPLRAPLQAANEDVQAGLRLSQALQDRGLATPVALRMLRVGESSGSVAAMLQRAASFHDEEATRLAELVSRSLNPALMLLMGLLIGTVVVLMYLPIFSLMEQVQ